MDELSIVSFPSELLRSRILWEQWIKNTLIASSLIKSRSLREVWVLCNEPLSDEIFASLGISLKFWRNSHLMIEAILNSSKSSTFPDLVLAIELDQYSLSSKTDAIDKLGQAQMARDLTHNELQLGLWRQEILGILQRSKDFLVQDVSGNFLNLDRMQSQLVQKLTPKLVRGGKYGVSYTSVSVFCFGANEASFELFDTIPFEEWSNPSYNWESHFVTESDSAQNKQFWCSLRTAGISRYVTTRIANGAKLEHAQVRDNSSFWGCCELRDFLCFYHVASSGSRFYLLDSKDSLRIFQKSLLEA